MAKKKTENVKMLHLPLKAKWYEMPESDFICIAAKNKTVSLSATDNSTKSIEKIFIPKHQIKNKPLTLFD